MGLERVQASRESQAAPVAVASRGEPEQVVRVEVQRPAQALKRAER
jgi:hypothetical protein